MTGVLGSKRPTSFRNRCSQAARTLGPVHTGDLFLVGGLTHQVDQVSSRCTPRTRRMERKRPGGSPA